MNLGWVDELTPNASVVLPHEMFDCLFDDAVDGPAAAGFVSRVPGFEDVYVPYVTFVSGRHVREGDVRPLHADCLEAVQLQLDGIKQHAELARERFRGPVKAVWRIRNALYRIEEDEVDFEGGRVGGVRGYRCRARLAVVPAAAKILEA